MYHRVLSRAADPAEADAALTYIQAFQTTRTHGNRGMAELLPCLDGFQRIYLRGLMDNLLRDLVMKKEKPMSRRAMLRAAGCGIGFLGLADVLAREAQAATSFNPLAPKAPHFEPRAKRVIFLFMHGGPSSIDTFDPKPRLDRDNGKPLPIKRPLAFADEAARAADEVAMGFQAGRPVRTSRERSVPACAGVHRRSVCDPLDGWRRRGSWGRAASDLYGNKHFHSSEHGRVDRVRLGNREPEPAGIRHHQTRAIARRSRRTGVRLSCRALIKVRRSATPA